MITAWIDATRPAASWQLWGMSLVERQLRQLALRGAGSARVAVAGNGAPRIRADFGSRYDLDIQFHQVSGEAGLGPSLAAVESPLLLLEGDGVYDDRVLDHLLAAGPGNSVAGGGLCAAWADTGLVAELARVPPGEGGVPGPALWKAVSEQTRVTDAARLDSYVPELRLTMAPVMVRLERPAQLGEVERLMYRRTFKGVIDIVASRGYYHPVRWITRLLAPTEVSPNSVTALSIAAIWLAAPCFALGMPVAGIALGWAGVIADSVDGKLARLTLNLSDRMGAVEHVSAVPALGLWLLAFGGWVSDWKLLTSSGPAVATWVLLACFALDKGVSGGFRRLTGREIFDYGRGDALFHPFAARRNILLLMMTVGVAADAAAAALAAMSAWMAATLLFHALRALQVAVARIGKGPAGRASEG